MRVDPKGNPIAREFMPAGLSKEERQAELDAIGTVMDSKAAERLIYASVRLPYNDRKAAEALVKENVHRRLKRDLHHLIDKMMELAEGVYYEEEVKNPRGGVKTRRIYKSKPDRLALEYLIDRELGTPAKISESKVKSEGTLKVLSLSLTGGPLNGKSESERPAPNGAAPVLYDPDESDGPA